MAVRIRLTRVGAKKQPTYRFVVADSRNARDGRSLATLGHYNPRTDPIEINVDAERAKEWMSRGAKPSDTVDRLFRRVGVLPERTDRPTSPSRGPKQADKQTKAAKRAAAPPAPKEEAPKETSPAETAQAASADEPAEGAVEAVEEPTAAAEPEASAVPTEPAAEAPAAEDAPAAIEAPAAEVEAPAAEEAPTAVEAPAAEEPAETTEES